MKLTVASLLFLFSAHAASVNPSAPVGGTFTRNIDAQEPVTVHPIAYADHGGLRVLQYVMDTLAYRNPETNEYEPRLAEKWETSKDQKAITFVLRKDATFHDGKPITAEDVKFSFDAHFEPAYKAADKLPYLEGISKVEVVDSQTVKFHLRDTYFQNFIVAAEMFILPKHVYSDVEKSKKMVRTAVGAGPYTLEKFEKGQRVALKRFDQWYGFKTTQWKGAYNFAKVNLYFIADQDVAGEMLKKGQLDYDELSADYFTSKTEGAPWGQSILKFKVENRSPKKYEFVAWNLQKPYFSDRGTRQALAHLMNREEMNTKFRHDMSSMTAGPFYAQSEYASPKVKPFLYDPKKAVELLVKAGWKDADKDGILDKMVGGKKVDFRFTLLNSSREREKYFALYKEDLKKAGIEMEVKYVDWPTFVKNLEDRNFDAVALAWQGSYEWDPKQIWHSSSDVPGGSNFIHYKNPTVDRLIDQARMETDKKKRLDRLHKIYELIAADAPYAYLFNAKYLFYANSNKVEKPAETFLYDVGHEYWWSKEAKKQE